MRICTKWNTYSQPFPIDTRQAVCMSICIHRQISLQKNMSNSTMTDMRRSINDSQLADIDPILKALFSIPLTYPYCNLRRLLVIIDLKALGTFSNNKVT